MGKKWRLLLAIVGFVAIPVLWYCVASDYDYDSLSGTYIFKTADEVCTLRLSSDRTFSQELVSGQSRRSAIGTWHRFGEAGTEFSSSFLSVPGQQPGPSGENYGDFRKAFGIFPVLHLYGGPEFRRTLFSFLKK